MLAGVDWRLGADVTEEQIDRVTNWMADALVAALNEHAPSGEVQSLWLTEPLGLIGGVAGAMVSGGVGEYVYDRETREFGDLGHRLGRAIRQRFEAGRV
jgi:ethanolamine utilization protein EutA